MQYLSFLENNIIEGLHWACCLMMTGLIWQIQLVHYPAFLWVAKERFIAFEKFHSTRISFIVMPLMVTEIATGTMIFLRDVQNLWWLINLVGIIGIWLSTFLLSVPCHVKLAKGWDKTTIEGLVKTNWPRTVIWTLRSAAIVYFFVKT